MSSLKNIQAESVQLLKASNVIKVGCALLNFCYIYSNCTKNIFLKDLFYYISCSHIKNIFKYFYFDSILSSAVVLGVWGSSGGGMPVLA